MTLLAPSAAILAGLIAAPIIVLLYLLKLRRIRMIASTASLWLAAQRDLEVNTPFRLVRAPLMLLLHLACAACLIIAIGRPAIEIPGIRADHVIILLDRSASMSSTLPDGTVLRDRALDTLRDLVDDLDNAGDPEYTLIALDAQPRVVRARIASSGALLDSAENLEPTDQPDDLPAALDLARSLIEQPSTEGETPPATVVVIISDAGHDPTIAATVRNADVRFEPVMTPEQPRENIGIVAASVRRAPDQPERIDGFVTLLNTSPTTRAVILNLDRDGTPIWSSPVTLPPSEEGSPSQVRESFTINDTRGGVFTLRIRLDDALLADNTASFPLPPPSVRRLWLVHPDNARPSSDLRDITRELPNTNATVLAASTASSLLAGGETPDILLYDRVDLTAFPPAPSILFGGALPPPFIPSDLETPTNPQPVLAWKRSDPLMRYVTLDGVLIGRMRSVTTETDSNLPIETLAEGWAGPAILRVDAGSARHIAVTFPTTQTNWTLQYSFAIFMLNAIEQATRAATPRQAFSLNERIELPQGGATRYTGPEESSFEVAAAPRSPRVLGRPKTVGIYRPDDPADPVIAANLLSPRESSLVAQPALQSSGRGALSVRDSVTPHEIWHWFVLAFALLSLLEWALVITKTRFTSRRDLKTA